MMGISKRLLALLVAVVLVSFAFSAILQTDSGVETPAVHENLGTRDPGTQRVVLLERFTNTGCGPCAYATPNEEIFTDDFLPDRLAVLKYHVWWPSGSDPMYTHNPSEQGGRTTWYGDIGGVPHIKVDGIVTPDYPYTYKAISDAYESRTSTDSPLSISMTGSLAAGTGSVDITVNAIDPPGSNLRLLAVLYENNIDYVSPPGSSGETHFEFTVRDMIPNENGETITLNQGETIFRTKTFTVDPLYVREQLGVVAFVQNWLTKEVIQAASYGFADMSVADVDLSFSNPTPVEGDTVTIYATVHNDGEAITNAVVRFFEGGVGGVQIGSDQTTGAIPSGGTSLVQANWNTAGLGGDHTIYVTVDADEDYWESDEYDNTASKDVFVMPLNDAAAIDLPTLNEGSLYPMGRYQVGGTVMNTGFNPQGPFPLELELRTLGSYVPQTIYSQSFDGMTDEGWGQNPPTGSWQRGSPIGLDDPVPSAPNCWGTNLMGAPPDLAHDFLVSPPLDVPAGSPSVTLRWWQYTDFEAILSGGWIYTDGGAVWISSDMGESWEMQASFYANESLIWVEHSLDLTPYTGQTILYAFEIFADIADWSDPYGEGGWYVDDVSVEAMLPEETTVLGPWQMDTVGTLNSMVTQDVNFLAKLVPGGQLKVVLTADLLTDTYAGNDVYSEIIDLDPNHYIFDLIQGWNLISMPLTPSSGDPFVVFSSINGKWDSLRFFDAGDMTDHWKELTPWKGYTDMPSLTDHMALWIHMTDTATLNLTGTIPVTSDVQLRKGWNFVGYPSLYDRDLPTALNNPAITEVQAFDPAAPPTYLQKLDPADMMMSGYGYWLYSTQGTFWTVSNQ